MLESKRGRTAAIGLALLAMGLLTRAPVRAAGETMDNAEVNADVSANVNKADACKSSRANWTQRRVLDYVKAFNDESPRLRDFFAADIVYPHISAGVMHGPDQIMDFYRTHFWNGGIREVRMPNAVVIDNANRIMTIEFNMRFVLKDGVASAKLPTGELFTAGEEWRGKSVMFYGLEGDRICSIRGTILGPGKIEKVSP